MVPGPVPPRSMLSQTGACRGERQSSLLGIVRQGPPRPAQFGQLQNKKRRLAQQLPRLPTIVEVEEEDDGVPPPAQSPPLPSGLPESLTDPFGLASDASWAEAFAMRLKTASKTERTVLLAWLSMAFAPLACSEVGSDVVQVACKVASGAQRILLISKLQGSIADLCTSPHGYQVVLTLVETMPVSAIGFIAEELTGRAGEIARNRFGYRVLEAMTMHCSGEQLADLAKELVLDSVELSRHVFGNFVIQHLLEYGSQACQSAIVQRLIPEIPMLAMDRTASHVVERALEHVNVPDQFSIAMTLLQAHKPVSIVDIACSRCGSCILIELARCEIFSAQLHFQLARNLPRLSQSKFGRRVIGHVAMPLPINAQKAYVFEAVCAA